MESTRKCSVDGCNRKHFGLGYCQKHRRAFVLYGDPQARKRLRGVDLSERMRVCTEADGECRVWTGYRNAKGYGVIGVDGSTQIASRVAYELAHGPIPRGLVVRHKCDNPPCVNPDHLEVGTHLDNARDMVERGRSARGENASQARLTWDQVREVRRRVAGGESRYAVARAFGVSQPSIWSIAAGESWKEETPNE